MSNFKRDIKRKKPDIKKGVFGYKKKKIWGNVGIKKSSGKNFFRGRGMRKKLLDPKLFIKKARPVSEIKYNPTRKYVDFNIDKKLKDALTKNNFIFPTEIQDMAIDMAIKKRDILGIADTGTGKTGAFLIPIINRFLIEKTDFKVIVILPTRELAIQVKKDFESITQGFGLFSACLVGGTSTYKDIKKLKMKNHFIVGTPGRLIDMVKQKYLKLDKTEILVLDEFDRMLDMGFIEDIKFLREKLINLKQTMLFSATLNKKLQPIIDKIVKDPFKILITSGLNSSNNVEQSIIKIEKGEIKYNKLLSLLKQKEFEKVIIFAETKRNVNIVSKKLKEEKISVEYIHGDKTQRAREFSLNKFKDGRSRILVATDVAARGLDIKNVTHVINYQAPTEYGTYIHRIGRTGRNGKMGHAITFVE